MSQEPERSATFERDFLEQVSRQAQVWGESLAFRRLVDAVHDRLEKGHREYGPGSFLTAPRHEVDEEAADLVAWSMLFAQASRAEGSMEDVADYAEIAALGAVAWMRCQDVRERRRTTVQTA